MNRLTNYTNYLMIGAISLGLSACSDEDSNNTTQITDAPFVSCLGITSDSGTSYYVVPVEDFMAESISATGTGIEQNGYRSFQAAEGTLFSIGGLGLTDANLITMDANGYLQQKSSFVFNNSITALEQADDNYMVAVDMPGASTSGDVFTFYQLNISTGAISKRFNSPVSDLGVNGHWPSLTGMTISQGKIYMTFYLTNETSKLTENIDTAYVAVYSYPDFGFIKLMKDERAPIAGSWNAYNGIFQTEDGDMYTYSNTSIANGFTQNSAKKAAFLHIAEGATEFDNYYFDVETTAGGFKPVHLNYLGQGKFFAEITTRTSDEMSRWADKDLRCAIIDVEKKTVNYINEIPVHNGDGGQRMSGIVNKGYFYIQIAESDGLYFYQVDINAATAVRGAKVQANFVSGSFRIN